MSVLLMRVFCLHFLFQTIDNVIKIPIGVHFFASNQSRSQSIPVRGLCHATTTRLASVDPQIGILIKLSIVYICIFFTDRNFN
jgi:hypothetical protein